MLAEGGYIVGKMATLKYPDGIDLSEEKDAITKTKELLSTDFLKSPDVKNSPKIVSP